MKTAQRRFNEAGDGYRSLGLASLLFGLFITSFGYYPGQTLVKGADFSLIRRPAQNGLTDASSSVAGPAGRPASVRQVKNRLGMEFVLVPRGSFEMGSNTGKSDEKPVHRVRIKQEFWLGKFEVTQGQWEAVMDTNPSFSKGASLPVELVTWQQVQRFIWILNANGEGEYRLPTEAEWEYACRAGTTGEHAGNLDAMAWYYENSGDQRLSDKNCPDNFESNNCRTHPVGQKQPNGWGLYDMHGNVWEWCQDWYDDKYYGKSGRNPIWSGPETALRSLRGGSFVGDAESCRSAARASFSQDNGFPELGFRIVFIPNRGFLTRSGK